MLNMVDHIQMDNLDLVEYEFDAFCLFHRVHVDYKVFEQYCTKKLQFITRYHPLKKNKEIEV